MAPSEASAPDQETQLRRPSSSRPGTSAALDLAAASVASGRKSPVSTDTKLSISIVSVKREDSSVQEEEEGEEAIAADQRPPTSDHPSQGTRALREWRNCVSVLIVFVARSHPQSQQAPGAMNNRPTFFATSTQEKTFSLPC